MEFLLHLLITPQSGKVRGYRPIISRIGTCTISPFDTAPSVSSTTPPLASRYLPVTCSSVHTTRLRWFLELRFESHIPTALSPSIFGPHDTVGFIQSITSIPSGSSSSGSSSKPPTSTSAPTSSFLLFPLSSFLPSRSIFSSLRYSYTLTRASPPLASSPWDRPRPQRSIFSLDLTTRTSHLLPSTPPHVQYRRHL